MPRIGTSKINFTTVLVAAGAFAAGYLISKAKAAPDTKPQLNDGAANAAVGYPRLPWNTAQPYNPDKSGYFNYATGGNPYSL